MHALRNSKTYLIPLLGATLVVFFLFFLDEGYYDLRWMKSPGNWVIFFFYLGFLLLGEALIAMLLLRRKETFKKSMIITLTGIPLGLAAALFFFSH